jgi:hypothetical protein
MMDRVSFCFTYDCHNRAHSKTGQGGSPGLNPWVDGVFEDSLGCDGNGLVNSEGRKSHRSYGLETVLSGCEDIGQPLAQYLNTTLGSDQPQSSVIT